MGFALPWKMIMETRTLAKAGLFKPPVLGTVFRLLGMFRVYFKNDVDFSVDKTRQEQENQRVTNFLDAGGCLAFCPEGTVNRTDPSTIQPLRRGAFKLAVQHNLPITAMVCVGLHDVWPPSCLIPGFPATIDVAITSVTTTASSSSSPDDAAQQAADDTQKAMQNLLDSLLADRRKRPEQSRRSPEMIKH